MPTARRPRLIVAWITALAILVLPHAPWLASVAARTVGADAALGIVCSTSAWPVTAQPADEGAPSPDATHASGVHCLACGAAAPPMAPAPGRCLLAAWAPERVVGAAERPGRRVARAAWARAPARAPPRGA